MYISNVFDLFDHHHSDGDQIDRKRLATFEQLLTSIFIKNVKVG